MIRKILYIVILLVFVNSMLEAQVSRKDIEARIDSVMNLMTLKEKVGQMVQVNGHSAITGPNAVTPKFEKQLSSGMVGSMLNADGAANTYKLQKEIVEHSRLGIPLMFGRDVIHGWRTIFPIPLGEAASWDLDMIEKSFRVIAREATAGGQQWTFAPMVDIARDARWGRIMEGAGEDPFLDSKVLTARIHGLQGKDLSSSNTMAACLKHFAAYGAVEGGRDYNTVDISERVLRNIYLPPFKAGIDAGALTIMSAFNEISGVPSTANKLLLQKILRDEWHYKGFVVSDAGAVTELINHGFAKDEYDATVLAVNAGCDMDMNSQAYYNNLVKAVKDGKVSEKMIDESVRRILRVKFMLGLFDNPYKYCNPEKEKTEVFSKANQTVARESAKRSFVLLKNNKQILPLKKDTKTIAIIGPLGDSKGDMNGIWKCNGKPEDVVTLYQGVKNAVSKNTKILYSKGCEVIGDDKSKFTEAINIAKKADVVILAIGESASMSGENRSRSNINIPGVQIELAKEIYKLGIPIVAVLFNGRPIAIPWLSAHIPSILEAWFPGTQAGNALADVLFGEYNPSGKLPSSFPITVGQCPYYYNFKNTGRPIHPDDPDYKWQTKYIDVANKPLYPFGFGLSYTQFKYSDLKLNKKQVGFNDDLDISVRLKNIGNYDGNEVAQLYVRDLFGSVTRPVKELKGFKKVFIKVGETKEVHFKLNSDDLRFYDINMNFVAEPGDFKVYVGGNSVNVLESSFKIVKNK